MSEKDLKTFYAVNVPKNIQILEAWKPTKDINLRLELFLTCFSTYELNTKFDWGT